MAYTVTVQHQLSETEGSKPCKLVLSVTSVTDFLDTAVFKLTTDGVTEEWFSVCNPYDMLNIPANVATGGVIRRNAATILYASADDANTGLLAIEAAVSKLCRDMTAVMTLRTATTTVITG